MKKIVFFSALLLSLNAHAQAGRGNFEVSGGLGWRAFRQIAYNQQPDNTNSFQSQIPPAIVLSGHYYLSAKCAIGLCIVQHSASNDYYNIGSWYHEYHYYDIMSLNFEVKPLYLNRRNIQVYGIYGLGVFVLRGRDTYSPYYAPDRKGTSLSMQIAPIGIKVGNKIGGFFEAGIGYKGVFNAGIVAQLGKSVKDRQYVHGKSKNDNANKRTGDN